MLGFSKKEEALMRNATGNGVAEAIPSLQHLFHSISQSLGVSVLRPGLLKEAFGDCIKSILKTWHSKNTVLVVGCCTKPPAFLSLP